jgi:hypothetical protein
VCAQIYGATDAETVFRVYQPPFLIAAAPKDTSILPILLDARRTHITGTVTQSLRETS